MITDEQIAQLKRDHGDIHRLTACGETVIVRKPTPEEYQEFRDYGSNDEQRPLAFARLLDSTVVWPDRAGFQALIKRLPGLNESFGAEVAKLAGLTRAVEVRKL